MVGTLPVAMLEEPYAVPAGAEEVGDRQRVAGAPWQRDWRGETFVPSSYQGYGGPEAAFVSLSQPTDWSPYTGLVASQPWVHGYAGTGLQETTLAELRAGSTIVWPTSGQTDPGFDPVLLEIPFDQGTDVGWQQWWTQGRRMLFQEPPDVSAQTAPIPAAGWP